MIYYQLKSKNTKNMSSKMREIAKKQSMVYFIRLFGIKR